MRILVLIFYMLLKRQAMIDKCVRSYCGDRGEYCSSDERGAAPKMCAEHTLDDAEFLYTDIPPDDEARSE